MDVKSFIQSNYKKVIGWGTGGSFDKHFEALPLELAYLIDSDEAKWNETKNGLVIKPPASLRKEDPKQTLIIVYSIFANQIREAAKGFGDFDVVTAGQLQKLAAEERPILEGTECDKPAVITISRKNFAEYLDGTSKFIREQMHLIRQQGKTHMHLYWMHYDLKRFRCNMISVVKNGREIGLYSLERLSHVLQKTEKLVIHHLIGMDLDFLDRILESLPPHTEVIYYLHDYSCICSSIKLMRNNSEYCNAFRKGWSPCMSCTHSENRERIHAYHDRLFRTYGKMRLIAPSENVKQNISAAFGFAADRIEVIPHQTFETIRQEKPRVHSKIRIAYVGYKSPYKGWDTFKEVVERYRNKYAFYCFGRTNETLDGVCHVDVSFIEDGPLAMVKKLESHGIDIAFLWSVWPETYSYTYFESAAAGAFIMTNAWSGNISEQANRHQNGAVLNDPAELYALLDNEEELRAWLTRPRTVFRNLRMNEAELSSLIS